MERRSFIKTILVVTALLQGLPARLVCFGGNRALASNNHDSHETDFTGSYFTGTIDHRILIPEELRSPLKKTGFYVVGLKAHGVLLVSAQSPLMELFDEIKDSTLFREDFLLLREDNLFIGNDGYLVIPPEMRNFAGIKTGKVSIIGRRNLIEIINYGE